MVRINNIPSQWISSIYKVSKVNGITQFKTSNPNLCIHEIQGVSQIFLEGNKCICRLCRQEVSFKDILQIKEDK